MVDFYKVKGTGPFAQLAANVISRNKGGVIAKEDPMKLIATKTAYLVWFALGIHKIQSALKLKPRFGICYAFWLYSVTD